jgi:protein SCO1/2
LTIIFLTVTRRKILLIGVVLLAAFGIGLWLGIARKQGSNIRYLTLDPALTVVPNPQTLKPFTLQRSDKKPFTLASLQGHWTMVFFGYTSCPDVCPGTLAVLHQVHELVGRQKAGNRWQTVFVSVDPARDTDTRLGQYVRAFDRSFHAATGSREQIDNLVHQLGAHYTIRGEGKGETVSHSAAVYLINPRAQYQALLTPPLLARSIVSRLTLVQQMLPD